MWIRVWHFWTYKKVIMITVKLIWWLGNQMFQYAFARKISLTRDTGLFFDNNMMWYDKREYELKHFSIKGSTATVQQKPRYTRLWKSKFLDILRYALSYIAKKVNQNHILENPHHPKVYSGMYDFHPEIEQYIHSVAGDLYIEWFRQSEKYFLSIDNIIRQDLQPKQPLQDERNKSIIEKMHTMQSISLHVRRTDYTHSQYAGICDKVYYEKAAALIQEKFDDPIFFIFSDDIQRCKENLYLWPQSYYIDRNTGADSYKDMVLMSNCRHNIIANSTFSWRWAWLNSNPDKIVIAPKQRHKNIDYKDIIPEDRVRL